VGSASKLGLDNNAPEHHGTCQQSNQGDHANGGWSPDKSAR